MLKPSEIVIRITQDVPTINKITFRAPSVSQQKMQNAFVLNPAGRAGLVVVVEV